MASFWSIEGPGGRFFIARGRPSRALGATGKKGRELVAIGGAVSLNKIVGLIVVLCALGGCASRPYDAARQAALQERDIAWAGLVKAIGAYCTARYESPSDRQACVIHKQDEARALQAERGLSSDSPRLSCARARTQTDCRWSDRTSWLPADRRRG